MDYCLKLVIEAWILGDKENVNREFLIRAIEAVGGYARVIAEIQKQGKLFLTFNGNYTRLVTLSLCCYFLKVIK